MERRKSQDSTQPEKFNLELCWEQWEHLARGSRTERERERGWQRVCVHHGNEKGPLNLPLTTLKVPTKREIALNCVSTGALSNRVPCSILHSIRHANAPLAVVIILLRIVGRVVPRSTKFLIVLRSRDLAFEDNSVFSGSYFSQISKNRTFRMHWNIID